MAEKWHSREEKVSGSEIATPFQCFQALSAAHNALAEKINHAAIYGGYFKNPIVALIGEDYPASRKEAEDMLENMRQSIKKAKQLLKFKGFFEDEHVYPEEDEIKKLRRKFFEALNEGERNQ